MEEFDTTTPEETESERQAAALAAIWEALDGLNERLEALQARISALDAKVEDLHATDSARRLNMTSEDSEWY